MKRTPFSLLSLFFIIGLFIACEQQTEIPEQPTSPQLSELSFGLSGFSLSDYGTPQADEPCVLYYKAGGSFPFSGHTDALYAHIGLVSHEWTHVQADWNTNLEKCRFIPTDEPDVWKLELTPSIRQWFGATKEEMISKIGVVVRNANGTKQTIDLFCLVEDPAHTITYDKVEKAPLPADMEYGINYIDDSTVTLVLKEQDSNGDSYDYAYVIGDFSQWECQTTYAMKRDEEAGCWWCTLEGLTPGKEYRFQYQLYDEVWGVARIADPYTEIVYSSDDKWIASTTYPNLPAYPTETSGNVGAFQTSKIEYEWNVEGYTIDNSDELIIYELLLRDFSPSKDLAGALAQIDYLDSLGINVIELMPVQEFDGNSSWGYNPSSYFAMDKAYGTREMYKHFIDECHKRDIAVILDVVYNHATGSHPMTRLYWDATGNCTATNNPWFNMSAPHPYSMFHDWNHENAEVRDYVKRNLEYLLTEYKVDGFRFDLTKGFTQRKCSESTASNYDQSRINILTDYYEAIKAINPEAVVILEHFCCDAEERELTEQGMKVWRNANNAYCQTAMGYAENSDFSSLWTGKNGMPFGGYVGFMESHDEERTAYKAKTWGAGKVSTSLAERMQRAALNAAFFFTVPGPKMVWQFGELGYDYSIEENGRTGEKPLCWEYLDVPERKALYDTYAQFIGFRQAHPQLFGSDVDFTWQVGSSNWSTGRYIRAIAGEQAFVVVGNFDTQAQTLTVELPTTGTWTNYFDSAEHYSEQQISLTLDAGEYRLLVNFK